MTDLGLFASCLRLPRRCAASSPGFALGRCHGSATGAAPPFGGRPTGGKIPAKPHPASVDLRDASLLPSKWSEKHICMTAQYNCKHGCSTTARMLLGSCSSAARPLQYYCISHAALLQRPCSRTAKAVQQTCRGEAEKPPRQGSPPVAQSVPSGQVRSAQGGREESGCLPLGIVHGPGTCVLFLPQIGH